MEKKDILASKQKAIGHLRILLEATKECGIDSFSMAIRIMIASILNNSNQKEIDEVMETII